MSHIKIYEVMSPAHDDRKGLGYGKHKNDFHTPRQSSPHYPYLEPDEYSEDDDVDVAAADELDIFVKKVNLGYLPSDFYRSPSKDPFYFTGGNHTLHEQDALVMKPALFKTKTKPSPAGASAAIGVGSTIPGYRTTTRPTGTKRGYFSAPPAFAELEDLSGPAYQLSDILDPEENHIKDLRALISAIHKEQEEASVG